MSDRLFLVNVEPPELRVAELRSGKLFDLDVERDDRMLGNIYQGVVENVLPGMDAAFVHIGEKRNALLYVGDAAPEGKRGISINEAVKSGQKVLVQVARPAVGGKGARVTTRLSLPGRHCILVANSEATGVSKRIESEEERGRLRKLADKHRPLDHGLILRTEAEGASESLIAADVALLLRQLRDIQNRAQGIQTAGLLHRDLGLLGRLARDRVGDDVSGIYIDHLETAEIFREQLRTFAPNLINRVQHYNEAQQILDKYGVTATVQSAALHAVSLPHGGSLVIDEAEALTAIDVNTGSFVGKRGLGETVMQTNLEAVEEIARQLRLRDIGGIVVVDFIDMDKTRDRVKVLNLLEVALKGDRAKTRIVQISPSGLVEMTRRRESQSLKHLLCEPCISCGGLGFLPRASSLAIDIRRVLREKALKMPGIGLLVKVHPDVACELLSEDGEWMRDLELQTGSEIWVRVDESLERQETLYKNLAHGIPLAGDLMPGSTLPIEGHYYLFPRVNPQYVLAGQTLVQIPRLADTVPEGRFLIVVTEAGRHAARGKLAGK